MVDHVKAVGRKLTFPKLALLGYTTLFFLYFMPFAEVQFVKEIPFENLFGGSWFAIIGIAFLLEGMAGLPDMRKTGSKFGAYIVIGLGIISLIIGGAVVIGGTDIVMDSNDIAIITVIILGLAIAMFVTMAYSELVHRKSFLHLLKQIG